MPVPGTSHAGMYVVAVSARLLLEDTIDGHKGQKLGADVMVT